MAGVEGTPCLMITTFLWVLHLSREAFITVSHHEATLPCSTSNTNFSGLTWRFNHSQMILTQTRADVLYTVSEEWRQQVKGVSESGSLMLQNLTSHHEGTYTCELRDAEETLITNTVLRIEETPHEGPSNTEVSCVFMESCILPCSFQGGKDVVVHWNQMTAGEPPVHSYYHNQDQLGLQDQSFRGRTSLFKDQISRGNASLQLTGVKVQDQGRYKCFTSTIRGNKESFINLKVDAPMVKVDLQEAGDIITCSSEGIYPEPELTWSTSPPSNVAFKNQTKVQETEQLLYNITGSLIRSDTDLIYSCNISTRSHWRRVTLFTITPASVTVPYHEATIPCPTSNTSLTDFSLLWRFNQSQMIVTQTRADVLYTVSEEWRQQVKGVSESGSLMLQNLSSHHEGTYTCELRDAEETLVTNTVLTMEDSPAKSTKFGGITGLLVSAVAAGTVIGTACYYKRKKECTNRKTSVCPASEEAGSAAKIQCEKHMNGTNYEKK